MLGDVNPATVVTSSLAQTVYRGHDNVTSVKFSQYVGTSRRDAPLDFSDVTRMVLTFPDTDPVISFDSADLPGAFDWLGQDPGVVRFILSQFALDTGVYQAELVVYDAQHTNGQVVVSRLNPRTELSITVKQIGVGGTDPVPLPPGGNAVTRTFGETLSALQLVYESEGAVYAVDQLGGTGVDQVLGITLTGGAAGASGTVQRLGTIDDTGWSWTEGLIFAGPSGTLTQTPPTTGWELVVGYAPSAHRLNINFDEPVELA